jgi:hypothetical protein
MAEQARDAMHACAGAAAPGMTTCIIVIVCLLCRATEGGSTAAFGLTAAQAGAMGVPAAGAGPVTSTSGATRIVLLVNCVNREELLDDQCAVFYPWRHCVLCHALRCVVCLAINASQ